MNIPMTLIESPKPIKYLDLYNLHYLDSIYAGMPIWQDNPTKQAWLADKINRHFGYRIIGGVDVNRWLYEYQGLLYDAILATADVFKQWDGDWEYGNSVQTDSSSSGYNDSESTSETTSSQSATAGQSGKNFTSANPRSTMAGNDEPSYYDGGSYASNTNTSEGSGSTASNASNSGHSQGSSVTTQHMMPDTSARILELLAVPYSLDLLYTRLEPMFSHVISYEYVESGIVDLPIPN